MRLSLLSLVLQLTSELIQLSVILFSTRNRIQIQVVRPLSTGLGNVPIRFLLVLLFKIGGISSQERNAALEKFDLPNQVVRTRIQLLRCLKLLSCHFV